MDLIDIGPVFEAAGYAEVNRNIVLHLHRLGVNIRVRPRSLGSARVELDPAVRSLLERMVHNAHIPRATTLFTFLGGFFEREPGCHCIGLTMLETDRIPQDWVARCNLMDEIWVPSRFNRATFVDSGVEAAKVRVMPLGVDESRFRPGVPPLPVTGRRGFAFLSVFEWIPRKGYDILLRAYLAEFEPHEDVCLILRVHDNSTYDPGGLRIRDEIAAFQRATGKHAGPPVILIPTLVSTADMARLYAAADCFVLPTRGEGWNMTAMEAMACGVPAICTNWSSHLDFMTADNSLLIDVEGLEPVPAFGIPNDMVYAGSRWARPSEAHLRTLMRWAYENRAQAREIGMRGSRDVLKGFTWEKAARRMYARLLEVEEEQKRATHAVAGDDRMSASAATRPAGGPTWAPPAGAAASASGTHGEDGPDDGPGGGGSQPPSRPHRGTERMQIPIIRTVPPPVPRVREIAKDGRYRGDAGIMPQALPGAGASDGPAGGSAEGSADRPVNALGRATCRVLMVVPSWGKRCGISNYARALVEGLETCGAQATVVASASPGTLLPPTRSADRVDIVHFQYEFVLYDIDGLSSTVALLRDAGVAVAATAHDFAPGMARHNGFVARAFSRLIVHSNEARAAYCRAGADPARVVVIPMGCSRYSPGGNAGDGSPGLDADSGAGAGGPGDYGESGASDAQTRAQLGIGAGPAVGFFGFCLPHKGMIELAMAVQEVRRAHPTLKCFMISSVAPYASSRAFAARLRETLDRLRLSDAVTLVDDYLTEREAVRLLHAMDVNVLPYRDHGLIGTSAAARTVMAAERPMIVTDVPFFSDLGPEVYKIPSQDPGEIAKALRRLLGDPALRGELVGRMRGFLKRHDWSCVAREHARLYREILEETTAGHGHSEVSSHVS
ncbi:MAG: glycosyltransferase family 4 protein [Bacillota bacterium]